MKKILRSKSAVLALLSVALILTIAAGGTFAYYTSTTEAHINVFTGAENIRARLSEPNWEEAEALKMAPGKSVKKDPMVTNTGQTDEYAALRLTFRYGDGTPMSAADLIRLLNLIEIDWTDKWTLYSGSITKDNTGKVTAVTQPLIYYYNEALSPGEVSDPIFSNVRVKTETDGLTETDLRWLQGIQIVNGEAVADPNGLGAFHIGVEGSAVQMLGYDTAADAGGALTELFP